MLGPTSGLGLVNCHFIPINSLNFMKEKGGPGPVLLQFSL